MKHYTYRIIIEPDERNTFHAYVPALPGCHTWGETMEETRQNIRDAINAYVRALKTDRESIPEDNGVEIIETVPVPSAKRDALSYA
ncbi:type II toxin-antitoxin system HicB family antitoxin [Candidatus Saganbacteria bacterium]|uniref:Type II toxin-antitoxin system HicB family antitoxin n=1 Tax=Candidatus Saganbacteria bacterium TaxID=2575572 RepID=A0A9D6YSW0_UNCSA|nr:type II toxin-antitoxin system HicB family antitoxin [Candidatus Saganbacteria bacterium]